MQPLTCPKCSYNLTKDMNECPSCGIILSKISDKESSPDRQVMGNSVLLELWKKIVQDYQNEALHEQFIQSSLQYNKLSFASQQYRKMMEVNPLDETSKKMQDKIIQLASFQMLSQRSERKFEKPPKWTTFAILASSSALFFGTFAGKPPLAIGGLISLAVVFGIRLKR